MQRVANSRNPAKDKFGAGKNGFQGGNLAAGQAATTPGFEWFDSMQEEMAGVIEAAGITLDATKFNQLYLAIKRIFIKSATLTDTGTANAYTAANSPALVLNDIKPGLTQQVLITNANTGASTYSPDGLRADPIYGLGLQALQGGELVAGATAILMSATIAGVNGGSPCWVLLECMGGAQQVPNATKSQHALPLGQANGLYAKLNNGGASSANLIPNSSAELGNQYWSSTPANPVVGMYAEGTHWAMPTAAIATTLSQTSNFIPINAGSTTYLQAEMFAGGVTSGSFSCDIMFYTSAYVLISYQNATLTATNGTSWTWYSSSCAAPANAAFAVVRFYFSSAISSNAAIRRIKMSQAMSPYSQEATIYALAQSLQGTAPAGSRSGLVITYSGTSSSVSVTANELIVKNSAGGGVSLRNLSLSATSGNSSGAAGSLDTGSWAFSTWYNLFVIYNPTAQTSALLWSLSATAPTLPSGYTHFARVGANKTQSATNYWFLGGTQLDRIFQYKVNSSGNLTSLPLMSSGAQGNVSTPTWVAVAVSPFIPTTAGRIAVTIGQMIIASQALMAPNNSYGGYASTSNPPPFSMSGGSGATPPVSTCWMTLESTSIYIATGSTSGGFYCFGWEDNL